jgi:hypothetical protein
VDEASMVTVVAYGLLPQLKIFRDELDARKRSSRSASHRRRTASAGGSAADFGEQRFETLVLSALLNDRQRRGAASSASAAARIAILSRSIRSAAPSGCPPAAGDCSLIGVQSAPGFDDEDRCRIDAGGLTTVRFAGRSILRFV